MPITSAIQKGSMVYVYCGSNKQPFVKVGILQGYTANTVSVTDKSGNFVTTYNEKGIQISVKSAK